MASFIVLAASPTVSTLHGLEVRYWFGFALLLIAAVLAGAQAWVATHPKPAADEDQAKLLAELARKASLAASQADEAGTKAREAVSQLGEVHLFLGAGAPSFEAPSQQVDAAVEQASAAQAAIKAAGEAADKAKGNAEEIGQEASDPSLLGIASTVATKLPLVGGAFIFALLGCAVGGFVDISFG